MNHVYSVLTSLILASACGAGDTGSSEETADDNTPGAPAPANGSAELRSLADVTRVARLSHRQYENTVSDLLGLEDRSARSFAPDATNGLGFDTSVDLKVDARLGPQYRASAERLAELAVADAGVVMGILSCSSAAPECPAEFVATFLERAFRRPTTEPEQLRFEALFQRGSELIGSGDNFLDGVRLVIEAALQSPQFLYRTELSEAAIGASPTPLNSWELASKLSYLVYDSMPDAELFALARAEQLNTPEQVQTAVTRLLESERALRKMSSFHRQVWAFERLSTISPAPSSYPNVPSDLATRADLAAQAFLEDVIESGGGLREFLTADYAFADAELLPLYGLSGPPELGRVSLEATSRQGLFMQVGFLASHAHAVETDPIHRGLFIQRNLLCLNIPDPPAGAATTASPSTDTPLETTRQQVEALTEGPACSACHELINPPGFAFEAFDAAGQLRANQAGAALDTSGSITLDGETKPFDDAIGLLNAVAASEDAGRCYAKNWLRFAHGRKLLPEDEAATLALSMPMSVKALVTTLAGTPEFLTRPTTEVSP